MGKASRWMMNLLLGKKGKNKIKEAPASFSEESMNSPAAVSPATPARWSFGMSFRKEKWRASHQKGSRSLDLISSFAALDLEYKGNKNMVSKAADVSLPTTQEAKGISQAREIAAATKIQAFYRSYLARKALRALRGLVKLQAVVRGHLVRKQTAAIIRQMQALMAIQVRARFQRIQMAESSQLVAKSQSLRYRIVTPEKGSKRVHRETLDMNPYENFGALQSRKDSRKHTEDEKTEHRFSCYSADLSGFCRVGDQHNQVSSFTTANKSARLCPPTRQQIPGRASFSYLLQQDNSLIPNYMAKTESCRAKSRSQSEPKKRPKSKEKPKSKRTPSFDGINFVDRQPSYSSNADEATFESLGPRFAKLYRPRRNLKDDGSSRNGNPNFWE